MYSLLQDLSHGTIIFDLVTLTLKFDLLLKNFNHGFYLVMVAARLASLSSDNSYLGQWCNINNLNSGLRVSCNLLAYHAPGDGDQNAGHGL